MSLILHQFHISPDCGKIRAILRYKSVPVKIRPVNPLNRAELLKISGQLRVPVLVDGRKVLTDSSDIARYLEDKFPDPPIYPRGRRDNAQALLWEDWADEALQRVVGPLKFLHKANGRKTAALEAANSAQGPATLFTWRLILPVVERQMAAFGQTQSVPRLLKRFETQMQLVADRIEGTFLVGDKPSVADFSVYGVLEPLEGLVGFSILERHESVYRWFQRMKALPPGSAEQTGTAFH